MKQGFGVLTHGIDNLEDLSRPPSRYLRFRDMYKWRCFAVSRASESKICRNSTVSTFLSALSANRTLIGILICGSSLRISILELVRTIVSRGSYLSYSIQPLQSPEEVFGSRRIAASERQVYFAKVQWADRCGGPRKRGQH